jgi:hypothetical protein
VFHLAARTLARKRLGRDEAVAVAATTTVPSQDARVTEEHNEKRTYEMLDLLLDNLPPERFPAIVDAELGSVLHYFAAINYAEGIGKLASAPYHHPPDLPNERGHTPVLIGIQTKSFDAVRQLLDFDLDVNRPCRLLIRLTPLQRIQKKLSTTSDPKTKAILNRMINFVESGKNKLVMFGIQKQRVKLS